MVAHKVPEPDWKIFRNLREVALDRFCARVLVEVEAIRGDASRSHHERYGAILQLLRERDEQLAQAFDDPRRSQMTIQLATIYALDLLVPEEVARFTPQTRTRIELLVKEWQR